MSSSSWEVAEVRRVLAPLRDQPRAVEGSEERIARRERVVARLESALDSQHRRTRRWRVTVPLLAAAMTVGGAAFALVGGISFVSPAAEQAAQGVVVEALQGRVVFVAENTSQVLAAGQRVEGSAGGELATLSASRARLQSGNVAIEAGAETQLRVPAAAVDNARRISLEHGEIRVSVEKQAGAAEVWVVTPNARVVVHGTVFSVAVDPMRIRSERTCVRVEEGLVAVHHDGDVTQLAVGTSWGCKRNTTETAEATPTSESESELASVPRSASRHKFVSERALAPRARTRRPEARRVEQPTAETQEAAERTLAVETALLRDALAAERVGRLAVAESKLRDLISQYPNSPLLTDARIALRRVTHAR